MNNDPLTPLSARELLTKARLMLLNAKVLL